MAPDLANISHPSMRRSRYTDERHDVTQNRVCIPWQARLERAARDREAEREALRGRAAALAADAARQVRPCFKNVNSVRHVMVMRRVGVPVPDSHLAYPNR